MRKARFGGLIRMALRIPKAAGALRAMEKVKAHQDMEQLAEGTLELRRARGNHEADKAAN